jgi:hypothetical protein
MDKRKIISSVAHGPSIDRPWKALRLLWSICAIAAILMSFEIIAYAADGIQEKSLTVKNWKGEHIGTSHHVILDPSTGSIVFIIVSLSQEENKEIAVPAGLFSVDEEHGDLVLNISKKKLHSSPAYHPSDLQDPEFVNKVYRFFAIAPPWTEDSPKEGNEHLLSF